MTRRKLRGAAIAAWRMRLQVIAASASLGARRVRSHARAGSRRGIVLVVLYGTVAIPGLLSSFTAVDSRLAADRAIRGGRLLSFPAEHSPGDLRTMDARDLRSGTYRGCGRSGMAWEYVSPAQGVVRVPSVERVWLELNETALEHPEGLAKLAPAAIYRLSAGPGVRTLNSALIAQISRLSGLRELDFRHIAPPAIGWDWLDAFPRMECVWLPATAPGDGDGGCSLHRDDRKPVDK